MIGPPRIAAERVQALREGFDAMVQDPEFIADVRKLDIELDPLPGATVAQLVAQTAVPAAVRERALNAFGR